jgi:SAM-dependent methyltransferase
LPHRTNSRSFATTYAFDEEARVFVPVAAHDDLAYSDGDTTEDGLLALMRRASDRSLHSPELAAGAVDWPTRYHLSPARANLLRPLAHLLRGRTLEVGSGCGELTRYLGELGGQLVALEGSHRRAAITAARCLGLDNVAVYNERLERFATDLRFSAITLVGVLEWASRFVDGVDGPRKVLEQAARLLDDDGVLVIAIENQLGLKYFAGWPEDHLGVAMSGINDTYRAGEPRTFGLRDLTARVAGAGFAHHAVYAPFPDYKFPRFVVSPSGLDDRAWTADMATIAAATPVTDPQGPALPLFSLEQTLALVARNGLLRDLSNSFLLVASRQAATVHDDPALLGWHYSGDRRAQYLRETRFRRSAHGITLEHRLLAPPAALPPLADDAIRHREATGAFWRARCGSRAWARS